VVCTLEMWSCKEDLQFHNVQLGTKLLSICPTLPSTSFNCLASLEVRIFHLWNRATELVRGGLVESARSMCSLLILTGRRRTYLGILQVLLPSTLTSVFEIFRTQASLSILPSKIPSNIPRSFQKHPSVSSPSRTPGVLHSVNHLGLVSPNPKYPYLGADRLRSS
jgi:hypothetical protein